MRNSENWRDESDRNGWKDRKGLKDRKGEGKWEDKERWEGEGKGERYPIHPGLCKNQQGMDCSRTH